MDEQETGYDYVRYKQLLAEAVDETRRLELIEIMIRENARDRLEAQRAADRIAMTVMTVARVLGPGSRRDISRSRASPPEASSASEPTQAGCAARARHQHQFGPFAVHASLPCSPGLISTLAFCPGFTYLGAIPRAWRSNPRK